MEALAAIGFALCVFAFLAPVAAVISYRRFCKDESDFELEVAAFWRDNS